MSFSRFFTQPFPLGDVLLGALLEHFLIAFFCSTMGEPTPKSVRFSSLLTHSPGDAQFI